MREPIEDYCATVYESPGSPLPHWADVSPLIHPIVPEEKEITRAMYEWLCDNHISELAVDITDAHEKALRYPSPDNLKAYGDTLKRLISLIRFT
jgi:hypothetical protein